MISREEALKYYLSKRPEGNHISDAGCKTIEIIFNSIGSCGECVYWENSKSIGEGYCPLFLIYPKRDWYCADFKRKTDGLEDDKC